MNQQTQILKLNSAALKQIKKWKTSHMKIGFTNGCFDILHPGHISLLRQAKKTCDRLVVGLNSDASVSRIKGPNRPIQNELARATLLSAMEDVDAIIIFEEDTPQKTLELVCPNVLIKGADYKLDEVIGGDFVKNMGGEVILATIEEGHSTSNLIKQMIKKE